MKTYYAFMTKKGHATHSVYFLLGMVFLWGLSVSPVFAQTNSGNAITFDEHNSTMLYSDLPTTQTGTQKYSCYLRHHQAPIQILNANPTAPESGTETRIIAPLQAAEGTGFFANSSLANNMGFSSDGKLQFYNFQRHEDGWPGSPYKYVCFAVIAPKGYRFTEYRMDIDGSQNNGANGATIMRYTYNEGSTYQFTECSGESMSLTDESTGQIFSHTLSNAANILYFRIEVSDAFYSANTQVCVTMNQFRLKYVIEDELEVSLPSADGSIGIHTGYIDFGELTEHTAAGQYFFNKTNVSDLQDVNIVAEDATAEISLSNGVVNVSKAGTYWVEAPAKYRIVNATLNLQMVEGTTETSYEDRGMDLASIIGKPVKISDGNGNYLVVSNNGTQASNTNNDANATTWYITQVSAANNTYYIKNANGDYLLRNSNGNLTTGTTATTWTYYENYSISWTYLITNYSITSDHCFITTSGSNNYGLRCNGGNWAASRQAQRSNTGANYTPCPIHYYEVVTTSLAGDYTATLYGTSATTPVGTQDISASNPEGTITATDLDNDGIKFTVDGPAAFTVNLTLAPLDPTLQTLEFGYRLKDGTTDAGHYISTNATNFKFNAGETIVIPIAPENNGNGDSHKVIFHNAINENRSAWYDGTGSGTKDSQYYLVGSEYEETGSTTTVPYGRTEANQAGTVEVEFSNLNSLTSGGGRLTETTFSKTAANYQDIVLADNGAAQTVYIYSADKPTHGIMAASGKAQNNHIAYIFYEATLQAVDIVEEPVIEVTTIYTSTLKGDNVKVSAYNAAMGMSVSVAKDSDLDTEHEFYGVKVTSRLKEGTGSPLGYLNCSDIITAIKAELSKETYKVYAGDVMRTILYVDMSELNSVSGDFDDWKEIMLGTSDNCLFFNPAGFSISQEMIGGGLIAGGEGGTAVTDIVVNDQQPFFSPYEFYTSTHKARYFRTKVNGKDLPRNTTIVLPFTVMLSPEGYLKTASDEVDENVRFYNLTTELTPGIGESWNVVTAPLTAASSIGAPLALAFKPYHLTSEEQTETIAFVVEVSGATIPVTPVPGADAFKNTDTGMVGYGSLNGVSIAKDEGIYYFSKEKFWNSSTLAAGKTVKILPYRAYYKTDNPGIKSLSEFGVNFDESVATGIKDIENENVAKGVYDLTGRRVSDDIQSLTRGIYIINGKKYFVK